MLNRKDIPTIVAALRYWQEEVTPHGVELALPYFSRPNSRPLSGSRIQELCEFLREVSIRYAAYDTGSDRIISHLLASPKTLQSHPERRKAIAVVLMKRSQRKRPAGKTSD